MPRLLIVLTVIAGLVLPSHAHLSLVRQGSESDDIAQEGDRHGMAVTAGDFNGDGFDDLATGAPHEDNDLGNNDLHGIVTISPGSALGVTHVGAYSVTIGAIFDSIARFGFSLAAGNFNNDPYDDLVVGVPYLDVNSVTSAGAVYVYNGGQTGLSSIPTIYTQPDFGGTNETGDLFGWSLVVGDFNNDGIDDLAIGGPGEDSGAGAVFHIHGSDPGGLDTGSAGSFKQADVGQVGQADERFGHSLAAGQVIGSTTDDLVVGAPRDTDSVLNETGRVTLIPGGGSGLTSVGSVNFNSSEVGLPPAGTPLFGWSVAVGRIAHPSGFNGVVDIAVGEPGHQADGNNSGRIVIYQTGSPALAYEQDDIPNSSEVPTAEDWFGWAVGTGDIDNDGFDDLFVSAPYKGRPNLIPNDGGVVSRLSYSVPDSMFPGTMSGTMDGDWLFDEDRDLELGYSITFGHFDDTGLGAFVFGAPAADYLKWGGIGFLDPDDVDEAGQAVVYAPHRQVFQLRSRSATAHNCDGEIIFSQRMFDSIRTASTLKILTNWIAAQHIKHDFAGTDSTSEIEVDKWVTTTSGCLVGCSSAGLFGTEMVKLIDLMRMTVWVSGNDAAMCIGDLLTGGDWPWPEDNCDNKGDQFAEFADTMNARALELGMTHSYFTNAAGIDTKGANGRPYSTALDMYTLMREAMKDPLAREIVGTEGKDIHRVIFGLGGDVPYKFNFLKTLREIITVATVTGAKPGKTEDAGRTAMAAGNVMGENESIATIFGISLDAPSGWRSQKTAELLVLALGSGSCPNAPGIGVLPLPEPGETIDIPGIPSAMDSTGTAVAPLEPVGNDILVEIYRENAVTPSAKLELCVQRETEHIIDAGETITLTASPFDSLQGIVLLNPMDVSADLLISHNQPLGTSFAVTLGPGEDSMVVAPSAFVAPSFMLSIENLSTTQADTINMSERGYKYDLTLPMTSGPEFAAAISFTGDPLYKNIIVRTLGKDPDPGNTFRLIVREPSVVVSGIRDDDYGTLRPPRAPGLYNVRSYPNPFNPETTIEYELSASGQVRIDIYDVAGRLVRSLTPRRHSQAGVYRAVWDGRNDHGAVTASGMYFGHVSGVGEARTVRLLLLK